MLCTTLLNEAQFPISDFQELYHKRSTAEEAFKRLKTRIELENFSGKIAVAVGQDFDAKTLAIAFSNVLAFPIERCVIDEFQPDNTRKHSQEIKRTSAIAMLQQILIPSFIRRSSNQRSAHLTIYWPRQRNCATFPWE